ALADVDYFKQVIDTYGHGVGDLVLRAVAGVFLMHVRPYDTVFRYGGEEFLIGLPNAEPDTAERVLDRLREALEQTPVPLPDGGSLPVRASFGMACVVAGLSLREAIERADRALYAAKRQGRNRVVSWSAECGP
ncbi:MAG: diguanylate cyclase, partial [Alphaproteobacteria bacterium]